MADIIRRNNVHITGSGRRTMVFAHGFGCDQHMWRFVAPMFERDYRVVCFDYVGAGGSDLSAYDPRKYAALDGYADDVLDIAEALAIEDGVFVGHSVSSMIGVLTARCQPGAFSDLILIGPSPRYIDDQDYVGGFSRQDIDELFAALDRNYLGWSRQMARVIMGNPERPELGDELANSFCRTDPTIASQFARATFLSDNRADLAHVTARALILQCRADVIAPESVGRYVHGAIPNSDLTLMRATGHCPNLSAPEETIQAMRAFL